MFSIGQAVQIYNHSDMDCNGEYGTIIDVDVAYSGERYYTVELEGYKYCQCTEDELVEG